MDAMEKVETTERALVFLPDLEIVDKKDHFLVTADVPGAIPGGAEIALEGDVLNIRVKAKGPEVGDLPLLYSEYEVGDYETTLQISDRVDRDKIEAELKEGVLTVKLAKTAEVLPKTINVKVA